MILKDDSCMSELSPLQYALLNDVCIGKWQGHDIETKYIFETQLISLSSWKKKWKENKLSCWCHPLFIKGELNEMLDSEKKMLYIHWSGWQLILLWLLRLFFYDFFASQPELKVFIFI